MAKLEAFTGLLLVSSFCLALGEPQQQDEAFTDDRDALHEPFISEKAELFRFSRSAKGGLFANMARYNEQQKQQQQQQQQLVSNDLVEVSQQQPLSQQQVAEQMPNFGSSTSGSSDSSNEQSVDLQQQKQHHHHQVHQPQPASQSSSSSSQFTKTQNSDSHPHPHHTHTRTQTQTYHNPKSYRVVKTITTTTTTHFNGNGNANGNGNVNGNQGSEPRVARLEEVRVHTVPLSEAVHYANYVVVPAGPNGKAARLEEASSSSSSSSRQSSSREETSSEVVGAAPAPSTTTLVLPPQSPPAVVSPDCQVLQRLIVERPVSSQLVVKVPSEVSVSQSSSSSSLQSSRVVELAAPEPIVYTTTTVRRVATPVLAARLVAATPVVEPVANDGHLKEEHFHSESRSSREESHGGPLGSLSSSSSSSTSSSSRSSKSSSTSTSTSTQVVAQPAAALLAAPVPVVRQLTVVQRQPVVAVKAAPLVAIGGAKQATNSYSVDVDHHYTSPNVKYGYSIKQQSQEPVVQQQEAKGLVVGDRVVYL